MWEILARLTPFAELRNPNAIIKYVAVEKGRPRLSDLPASTNTEVDRSDLAQRLDGSLLERRC